MPGHTRLFRRNATYYHRATVPKDIRDSYGKSEETFSLRTRDHAEALRKVRIAAVEVDKKFDEHRLQQARLQGPELSELTPEQITTVKAAYLHHLLDEDEDIRLDGFEETEGSGAERELISAPQSDPRPTFEEWEELVDDMSQINRHNLARGKVDHFHRGEAEKVLSWTGVGLQLAPSSRSWPRLIRSLQEAHVDAAEAIRRRNMGDSIPTTEYPAEGSGDQDRWRSPRPPGR